MVEGWGERIIADDGTLDRQAVAAIVFNDADELEALNGIVHPAVAEELKTQREAVQGSDAIVVLDIPLLVRADGTSDRDRYANLAGIVVVDVDPDIALNRLVDQRGFDENDARARIANQASREQRRAVADVVIDNSGSLDALTLQVDDVWSWAQALPPVEASDSSGDSCAST